MLSCYIACSYLERDTLYPQLASVAESLGFEITYRWPETSPPTDDLERAQYRRREAKHEIYGVTDADIVIVSLGGRLGTHAELGAALAGERRVILLGDLTTDIATGDPACVFYDHPNVRGIARDLVDLKAELRDQGAAILAGRIVDVCRAENIGGHSADLLTLLRNYDRLTS